MENIAKVAWRLLCRASNAHTNNLIYWKTFFLVVLYKSCKHALLPLWMCHALLLLKCLSRVTLSASTQFSVFASISPFCEAFLPHRGRRTLVEAPVALRPHTFNTVFIRWQDGCWLCFFFSPRLWIMWVLGLWVLFVSLALGSSL